MAVREARPYAGALFSFLVDVWRWLIDLAMTLLPDWATPAVPSLKKYSLTAMISLGLLAWSFLSWSRKLETRIETLAEWAWAEQKFLPPAARPATGWQNAVAKTLRPVTGFLYRYVWRKILVNLLGIMLGVAALILL